MLRRNTWVWHWDWTAIVLLYTLRTPSVSPPLFTNPFATRRTSTSIHINLTGRVGSLEKLSSSAARDGRHQSKGVKEETAAEPGTETQRQKQRMSRSCSWGLRLSALALVPQLSTRSCCCHFPLSLSLYLRCLLPLSSNFSHEVCAIL